MHKLMILRQFENFTVKGKSLNRDWVESACFRGNRRKFTGHLIFIFLFSSCLKSFSKKNCFHVYRKLNTCLTVAKRTFFISTLPPSLRGRF